MSDFSVRVLFIHHRNDEVTQSNYQSFIRSGNKVTPLRDSDVDGLEGSVPVAISGLPIPRSDRYWSSDTIAMNYVLMNEITESHVLLCEWDVHCEANLEQLLKPYESNDVTAAELLTVEKNGDWQHFKQIDSNVKMMGLLPGTCILFKTNALQKISIYCKENWNMVKKTNNECRLGTIASVLEMVIEKYEPHISRNIKWHGCNFVGKNLIYHPCKKIDMNIGDDNFSHNIYYFYGSAMGDQIATISGMLHDANKSDTIYVESQDTKINNRAEELIKIFDTNKQFVFVDSSFHPLIARQSLGPVQNHQFQYYKSKYKWIYNNQSTYDICYQFDSNAQAREYLPSKFIPDNTKTLILKMFSDAGYKIKELGKSHSIECEIDIMLNSKIFIGIDSGMSILAHIIDIPTFIKEFDKSIPKKLDWHYLDFFHANQYFSTFYDEDEIRRKVECFMNLPTLNKINWKQTNLFKVGWSDRSPTYKYIHNIRHDFVSHINPTTSPDCCKMSVNSKDTYTDIFNDIYLHNRWGNGSGPGSRPDVNTTYLCILNKLIAHTPSIKNILDIGCGDWQIMKNVVLDGKKYLGIDVASNIVEKNIKEFSKKGVDFKVLNPVTEDIPHADLIIVKDVLQHLPTSDVIKILEQIKQKSKFALITNDYMKINNRDTIVGGHRPINILAYPFNCFGVTLYDYLGKHVVLLMSSYSHNVNEDKTPDVDNKDSIIHTQNKTGLLQDGIKYD